MIVAIIDDDEIFQFTTKVRLEKFNTVSEVLTFEDGEIAFEHLNSCDLMPQLILLDINMPIVDGWDFLELFKTISQEKQNSTQIYMVSSSINPEDLDRAKTSTSIEQYLTKPLIDGDLEKIFNKKGE